MKSKFFYTNGTGKLHAHEKEKPLEIKVRSYTFNGPEDRQAMLEKLHICSQFDMRYRGLLEFYSNDLAAYKRKKGSGKHANEFLRILAKHFTDHLEDKCPSSWEACQPSFWEELIHITFPRLMKISTKQRESEIFLLQLNRFVRWLDQRVGTSWYELVKQYTETAKPELIMCERLINYLVVRTYPSIHQNNWNFKEERAANDADYNQCTTVIDSVYQVEEVCDNIITVTDLDTSWSYKLANMPSRLISTGMLLQGSIGKKRGDYYWNWLGVSGVYPAKAKNHFTLAD
ncbi:hypothetical protein P5G51_014070 [Virgibacillus sp. 179-BFC.A HS]|uniref:Uncharacterized protein n=1 Tax=Tigheibacillus jepli TaxID=3035914 RepID=A0ABU5CKL9_9BACI|nr:hypothetical protein [Virgibacillus sp. 179-BFC.A HS]MDY0406364.1 hypothetical protein [Virgibacillus sp. 179-BFC.A HS]